MHRLNFYLVFLVTIVVLLGRSLAQSYYGYYNSNNRYYASPRTAVHSRYLPNPGRYYTVSHYEPAGWYRSRLDYWNLRRHENRRMYGYPESPTISPGAAPAPPSLTLPPYMTSDTQLTTQQQQQPLSSSQYPSQESAAPSSTQLQQPQSPSLPPSQPFSPPQQVPQLTSPQQTSGPQPTIVESSLTSPQLQRSPSSPFSDQSIAQNIARKADIKEFKSSRICNPGPPLKPHPIFRNCLIIGDSIAIAYLNIVKYELRNLCQVQHSPFARGSGAADSRHGIKCLPLLLKTTAMQPTRYDAIVFNFGMHDIDYSKGFPEEYVSIKEYRANLKKLKHSFLETGAKVAFALTTPFPVTSARNRRVIEYNQAAIGVMESDHKIPVIDLYSVITNRCGQPPYSSCPIMKGPRDVHYNKEGNTLLGNRVAAAMKTLLALQPPRKPYPGINKSVSKRGYISYYALQTGSMCPDAITRCPAGSTCCESLFSLTGYGCCMLPDAVHCSDNWHCCPSGTSCSPICNIRTCQCIRFTTAADAQTISRETSAGKKFHPWSNMLRGSHGNQLMKGLKQRPYPHLKTTKIHRTSSERENHGHKSFKSKFQLSKSRLRYRKLNHDLIHSNEEKYKMLRKYLNNPKPRKENRTKPDNGSLNEELASLIRSRHRKKYKKLRTSARERGNRKGPKHVHSKHNHHTYGDHGHKHHRTMSHVHHNKKHKHFDKNKTRFKDTQRLENPDKSHQHHRNLDRLRHRNRWKHYNKDKTRPSDASRQEDTQSEGSGHQTTSGKTMASNNLIRDDISEDLPDETSGLKPVASGSSSVDEVSSHASRETERVMNEESERCGSDCRHNVKYEESGSRDNASGLADMRTNAFIDEESGSRDHSSSHASRQTNSALYGESESNDIDSDGEGKQANMMTYDENISRNFPSFFNSSLASGHSDSAMHGESGKQDDASSGITDELEQEEGSIQGENEQGIGSSTVDTGDLKSFDNRENTMRDSGIKNSHFKASSEERDFEERERNENEPDTTGLRNSNTNTVGVTSGGSVLRDSPKADDALNSYSGVTKDEQSGDAVDKVKDEFNNRNEKVLNPDAIVLETEGALAGSDSGSIDENVSSTQEIDKPVSEGRSNEELLNRSAKYGGVNVSGRKQGGRILERHQNIYYSGNPGIQNENKDIGSKVQESSGFPNVEDPSGFVKSDGASNNWPNIDNKIFRVFTGIPESSRTEKENVSIPISTLSNGLYVNKTTGIVQQKGSGETPSVFVRKQDHEEGSSSLRLYGESQSDVLSSGSDKMSGGSHGFTTTDLEDGNKDVPSSVSGEMSGSSKQGKQTSTGGSHGFTTFDLEDNKDVPSSGSGGFRGPLRKGKQTSSGGLYGLTTIDLEDNKDVPPSGSGGFRGPLRKGKQTSSGGSHGLTTIDLEDNKDVSYSGSGEMSGSLKQGKQPTNGGSHELTTIIDLEDDKDVPSSGSGGFRGPLRKGKQTSSGGSHGLTTIDLEDNKDVPSSGSGEMSGSLKQGKQAIRKGSYSFKTVNGTKEFPPSVAQTQGYVNNASKEPQQIQMDDANSGHHSDQQYVSSSGQQVLGGGQPNTFMFHDPFDPVVKDLHIHVQDNTTKNTESRSADPQGLRRKGVVDSSFDFSNLDALRNENIDKKASGFGKYLNDFKSSEIRGEGNDDHPMLDNSVGVEFTVDDPPDMSIIQYMEKGVLHQQKGQKRNVLRDGEIPERDRLHKDDTGSGVTSASGSQYHLFRQGKINIVGSINVKRNSKLDVPAKIIIPKKSRPVGQSSIVNIEHFDKKYYSSAGKFSGDINSENKRHVLTKLHWRIRNSKSMRSPQKKKHRYPDKQSVSSRHSKPKSTEDGNETITRNTESQTKQGVPSGNESSTESSGDIKISEKTRTSYRQPVEERFNRKLLSYLSSNSYSITRHNDRRSKSAKGLARRRKERKRIHEDDIRFGN